jgi:hypothetical protein
MTSVTSSEAGGIALVVALFTCFCSVLAVGLAVNYSHTNAVKAFVRGWDIFVTGLVWIAVFYCSIAFGTWHAPTEDDLRQKVLTIVGFIVTTVLPFLLYLWQACIYYNLCKQTGWTRKLRTYERGELSGVDLPFCLLPLSFSWCAIIFGTFGIALDIWVIRDRPSVGSNICLAVDIFSYLLTWTTDKIQHLIDGT